MIGNSGFFDRFEPSIGIFRNDFPSGRHCFPFIPRVTLGLRHRVGSRGIRIRGDGDELSRMKVEVFEDCISWKTYEDNHDRKDEKEKERAREVNPFSHHRFR